MGERTKYSPEALQLLESVDAWFLKNETEIVRIMESYREEWANRNEKEFAGDALDMNWRTLSEMPICWSLQRVSGAFPIKGFRYISPRRGRATVGESLYGEYASFSTSHGFLLNETTGMIACPTFGQFVLPYLKMTRGSRVAYVEAMAPSLVLRGENGLALLRGQRDEVCNLIGLEYMKRKERD